MNILNRKKKERKKEQSKDVEYDSVRKLSCNFKLLHFISYRIEMKIATKRVSSRLVYNNITEAIHINFIIATTASAWKQ